MKNCIGGKRRSRDTLNFKHLLGSLMAVKIFFFLWTMRAILYFIDDNLIVLWFSLLCDIEEIFAPLSFFHLWLVFIVFWKFVLYSYLLNTFTVCLTFPNDFCVYKYMLDSFIRWYVLCTYHLLYLYESLFIYYCRNFVTRLSQKLNLQLFSNFLSILCLI